MMIEKDQRESHADFHVTLLKIQCIFMPFQAGPEKNPQKIVYQKVQKKLIPGPASGTLQHVPDQRARGRIGKNRKAVSPASVIRSLLSFFSPLTMNFLFKS